MAAVNPADLVFLDETATPTTLTPVDAHAPRGMRAVGRVARGRRKPTSWLVTLPPTGMGGSVVVAGAVDRAAFDAFVEHLLVPSLRAGQIVVLDNLSVHKSPDARRRVKAAGCRLVFLPTSSPEFNPIERAFEVQGSAAPGGAAHLHHRGRGGWRGLGHRHRSGPDRVLPRCRLRRMIPPALLATALVIQKASAPTLPWIMATKRDDDQPTDHRGAFAGGAESTATLDDSLWMRIHTGLMVSSEQRGECNDRSQLVSG